MNEESAAVIAALVVAGADIRAIAGLPVESAGATSDFVDLSVIAATYGISWLPVTDINAPENRALFTATGADMLFVLGWSQLITNATLEVFPQGVIGSHPSLLPYGRGRAPVAWTILEDLRESAVTLFRMGVGVDDGTILKQVHFMIPGRANARIVYDLVTETLAHSFTELYAELKINAVTEIQQDRERASWRSKRGAANGWIDFRWPAERIDRVVRAVSEPYPGAYSYINGERAIFQKAKKAEGENLRRKGVPGQVLARQNYMLLVQAGDKPLWLEEPDLPVNRSIKIRIGDCFGFDIEDEIHILRQRVEALEHIMTEGSKNDT